MLGRTLYIHTSVPNIKKAHSLLSNNKITFCIPQLQWLRITRFSTPSFELKQGCLYLPFTSNLYYLLFVQITWNDKDATT